MFTKREKYVRQLANAWIVTIGFKFAGVFIKSH